MRKNVGKYTISEDPSNLLGWGGWGGPGRLSPEVGWWLWGGFPSFKIVNRTPDWSSLPGRADQRKAMGGLHCLPAVELHSGGDITPHYRPGAGAPRRCPERAPVVDHAHECERGGGVGLPAVHLHSGGDITPHYPTQGCEMKIVFRSFSYVIGSGEKHIFLAFFMILPRKYLDTFLCKKCFL